MTTDLKSRLRSADTWEMDDSAAPQPILVEAETGRASGRPSELRPRRPVRSVVALVACLAVGLMVAVPSRQTPGSALTVVAQGDGPATIDAGGTVPVADIPAPPSSTTETGPTTTLQTAVPVVAATTPPPTPKPTTTTPMTATPAATPTTVVVTAAATAQVPRPFPQTGPIPFKPPAIDLPAADPSVSLFPVPTPASQPSGLATGPDGNLWFTEANTDVVGRITPRGVITEFHTPTAHSQPGGIIVGPDRNLWFTESSANNIGRITTAGTITEFAIPTAHSQAHGKMAVGADGAVWFTETNSNRIGRVTMDGQVSEFPLDPSSGPDAALPTAIVAGPHGYLWFVEANVSRLGRISTAGTVTEFDIRSGYAPQAIAVDEAGTIWYAEFNGATGDARIAHVDSSGHSTDAASVSAHANLTDLLAGPDGTIWFTESNLNQIGHIGAGGTVTERLAPAPVSLTVGPDGAIWFTSGSGNEIGRLN